MELAGLFILAVVDFGSDPFICPLSKCICTENQAFYLTEALEGCIN